MINDILKKQKSIKLQPQKFLEIPLRLSLKQHLLNRQVLMQRLNYMHIGLQKIIEMHTNYLL